MNLDKLEVEHRALVKVYEDNGVQVVFLEADPVLPDLVFVRDLGDYIREGYILGKFREPIRQEEQARMESLGVPLVMEVKKGFFEGGDFFFLDDTTLAIGMIARSNAEGVEEIRRELAPLGYTVIGVPAKPQYLHLDMCFNLVSEKLAVSYPPVLPGDFLAEVKKRDIEIIPGDEDAIFAHGYNLQAIGDGRVISLKQNITLNEALDKRGFRVIEVDITEILKAGGGPHCMTFPLERV
jgi:N-dimethylarginine dimethylaminohydrolase